MVEKAGRNWSEMLPVLLEVISDHLSIQDYLVFCCVCRHWRSAPSSRSEILHFPKNTRWCIFYGFDSKDMEKCYLYSISHPKSCQVRLPPLRGATCVISKSGWLLAKRNRFFFFFNPLSGTTIDLPEHPLADVPSQVATFSFLPTSPECTAFVISCRDEWTIELSSCRVGDREWDTKELILTEFMLGNIKLATYCCDSFCPCENKDYNCIFIWGSRLGVTYRLAYTEYRFWMLPSVPSSGLPKCDLPKCLSDIHSADWSDKFGENGFYLSSCAIQLTNRRGMPASSGVFPADGPATTEWRVKAAWIDPVFSRVLSEESQRKAQDLSQDYDDILPIILGP